VELTESLLAAIKSGPGQRMEEIAKGLGTSTSELTLPAKKLLADKKIKTKGERRATKYFPA
jgi:predicted transcriptional regulator